MATSTDYDDAAHPTPGPLTLRAPRARIHTARASTTAVPTRIPATSFFRGARHGFVRDELSVTVIPQRADEFTCSSCFLVQHRNRMRNSARACPSATTAHSAPPPQSADSHSRRGGRKVWVCTAFWSLMADAACVLAQPTGWPGGIGRVGLRIEPFQTPASPTGWGFAKSRLYGVGVVAGLLRGSLRRGAGHECGPSAALGTRLPSRSTDSRASGGCRTSSIAGSPRTAIAFAV